MPASLCTLHVMCHHNWDTLQMDFVAAWHMTVNSLFAMPQGQLAACSISPSIRADHCSPRLMPQRGCCIRPKYGLKQTRISNGLHCLLLSSLFKRARRLKEVTSSCCPDCWADVRKWLGLVPYLCPHACLSSSRSCQAAA